MRTSNEITKIAAAMLAAQKQITFAVKESVNPHFRSRYADLSAVIEAIKPALNEAGIVFMQFPGVSENGTILLTTRLQHESGEWIESTSNCPLAKIDPQGYGSALTYMRRYSLAAAVGLYQDDQDANDISELAPIDRTLVMKVRSRMQENIAADKPVSVYEEWEAAQDKSTEFAKAVWSGLTTPEREYVRQINTERKK